MKAFVITFTIIHGLDILFYMDNALRPEKNIRDADRTRKVGVLGSVVSTGVLFWGMSVLGWV